MTTQPILKSGDTVTNLRDVAPEPVSLALLKASKIPVEWYEGVAIVQEASRHLLDSPRPPQPGSDLSVATVRIDMTGRVIVSGDAVPEGASAVSQLGALLRDLMPDNMPVPLRLAVSQAMSNPPHYASIKSFSEALSYFERPDRTGIVRTLYERWEVNAGGRTAPQSHVEPADEGQPATERRAPRTAGMPRWMVVAGGTGLAIALGLALAANWMWISNKFTFNMFESSAPSSDRPAEALALGSPIPEAARTDTKGNLSIPRPVTATAGSNQNTGMEPGRVLSKQAAAPVQALTTSGEAPLPSGESLRSANQPNPSVDQTVASATVLEAATGSRRYSALDTDVAAPVAAYPQSPIVATVLHDDEVLTFDVVIDEAGKVESVKLRRAPSSIRSALMLTMSMSVVKAWRFQPATRNGQSVKYLQSISVPAPQ